MASSWLRYRYRIPTKRWWRLLRQRKTRYGNWDFWRLIARKSKLFSNFATCQLCHDFSDQIVRHDNPSVHVQGLNAPCERSRIRIALYISQKDLRLGRMAASEWTRSVRAVRDTPVADYSFPAVNTTRHIAYRPPIAFSPFLLVLSVFYCTQILWRCGQLWPYIGMSSLGTHLHRHCRCENLFSSSFYIKLEERRKKVRKYNTTWPWGSTKSRKEWVRPKVANDRVRIFVVCQDGMKMICCLSTPGSPEYILHVGHSTSITPFSLYTHRCSLTIYLEAIIKLVWRWTWRPRSNELSDALGGLDRTSLEMHWEGMIERCWRCTWRPRLSERRDALGGRDRVNWEMHSEAVNERVSRFTWRPRSSELRAALGGRDRVNWELHLEAVIERVWRCTWRPWPSELRAALGGHDRSSLQMHLEAEIESTESCTWRPWSIEFGDALGGLDRVHLDALGGQNRASLETHLQAMIERDWRSTWRWSVWRERDGNWNSIHWLTCNCGNEESWVHHPRRDEKLGGCGRDSILGWCCSWCMLYSVLTHDYGMER